MKTITLHIPDKRFWSVLRLLKQIEDAEISYEHSPDETNPDIFGQTIRPIAKSMSVEALCRKQHFRGIDHQEFSRLRDMLAVKENVDELIALL